MELHACIGVVEMHACIGVVEMHACIGVVEMHACIRVASPMALILGIGSFGDTMTALLYDSYSNQYLYYGRVDGHRPTQQCPGNYPTFRNVALATAPGSNYTNVGPVNVIATWDEHDRKCVDLYNAAPIKVGDALLLFPSAVLHLTNGSKDAPFHNTFRKNDGLLDIRMLVSRHPSNTSYVTRAPFVSRGMGLRNATTGLYNTTGAAWDAGLVFMATGIYQHPTSPITRMLYFGGQITHGLAAYNVRSVGLRNIARGWGAVEVRQEGFGYAVPTRFWTDEPALLRAHKPLPMDQGSLRLWLNADISIGGGVTVALLDADNENMPITGYGHADCAELTANDVRIPVQWYNSSGSLISNSPGNRPVVVEIALRSGRLYSLLASP
eukprot:TRINITY_DN9643_c0_g1_i2.p1 TRINITY_DN9643_c0_g1~~TRINITY_DN9643_c0_g1_i2.p1  ORF type:complete len:382 (+),score=65.63 TRINITY_DN9643_c0_g1_i2:209-1354(+)